MIQQMKIQMDKIWVRGGIGNHGRFKWKYLNMYGYSWTWTNTMEYYPMGGVCINHNYMDLDMSA